MLANMYSCLHTHSKTLDKRTEREKERDRDRERENVLVGWLLVGFMAYQHL